MLGVDHLPVGPAEEYLEFLRVQAVSPNTVKSYARGLALWWQYLTAFGLSWDRVRLDEVGGFLAWLRTGDGPDVVSIEPRHARFAESTIAVRLRSVMSCYDFHQLNGVGLGGDLTRLVTRRGAAYRPLLEHVARRRGRRESVVRVRGARPTVPPTLTPGQIELICSACAAWDQGAREWRGSVRDRFLWALLAETGLRLGEALGLQHRDWHTGRGDTAFVEVVPREHPHRVRVKGGGYRRLYVSDKLDRLYGEYLWRLCEAGIEDAVADLDTAHVFVNLAHSPRLAPWRPESVYDVVRRLRRQLAGQVPAGWTPHWFRHSHATALLLSGVPVHVVSRRLGHTDVQTTLNVYAHVTEDAEMRTVAQWKAFTAGLLEPTFAQTVEETLAMTGLDPRALTLEITESVLATGAGHVIGALDTLRRQGVRVAIDDFGTGYSSLAALADLPVDTLKIDKRFVDSMLHDTRRHGLVRAIIGIARTLGLSTVAEGAERPEQRDALVALGCEYIQGYLFAEPMPPDRALDYIRRQSQVQVGPRAG